MLAIHLDERVSEDKGGSKPAAHELFHDLEVDFLHVDLLAELSRELGRLQKSCINSGSHGGLDNGDNVKKDALLGKDAEDEKVTSPAQEGGYRPSISG